MDWTLVVLLHDLVLLRLWLVHTVMARVHALNFILMLLFHHGLSYELVLLAHERLSYSSELPLGHFLWRVLYGLTLELGTLICFFNFEVFIPLGFI